MRVEGVPAHRASTRHRRGAERRGVRRGTLAHMTTNVTPGWSGTLPDPVDAAADSTRWGSPAADYPQGDRGISTWGEVDAPAAVPPPVAEGPHTRPGWLTRGRAVDRPDLAG